MPINDASTVAPSDAELWIRYHRKVIIASASIVAAFFALVRDGSEAHHGLTWTVVLGALFAVGQTAATYYPGNAVAKLFASFAFVVGGAFMAAIADHFTVASTLLVLTQVSTWVAAGATENGAAPDVARAAGRHVAVSATPDPAAA